MARKTIKGLEEELNLQKIAIKGLNDNNEELQKELEEDKAVRETAAGMLVDIGTFLEDEGGPKNKTIAHSLNAVHGVLGVNLNEMVKMGYRKEEEMKAAGEQAEEDEDNVVWACLL